MMQALATLVFTMIGIGALALIGRLLMSDWDAVCSAFGLRAKPAAFNPLPPRYRVNSRGTTFVTMKAAPLRHAA